MKNRNIIIAWLPMVFSYIMLPCLMLTGGRDLGAYGSNSSTMDLFVTLMWIFIPLGLILSVFSSFLIFIAGLLSHNRQKIRESITLFLFCLLYPLFWVTISNLLHL